MMLSTSGAGVTAVLRSLVQWSDVSKRHLHNSPLQALALLNVLTCLSQYSISPSQRECDTDVAFILQYSTVIYSVFWPAVGLCIKHY